MTANWTSVARQLCHHLQQNEARFTLLQQIDSAILEPDVQIDQIIEQTIHETQAEQSLGLAFRPSVDSHGYAATCLAVSSARRR